MKPATMVLRASRKAFRAGRAQLASCANRGSAATRARGAEICGLLYRGAWPICLAGARFAVPGFARTAPARGVAGGDGARTGNIRNGTGNAKAAEAASFASKRRGNFSPKISYFIDAGAEVDRRRRGGFSKRFANVRGAIVAGGSSAAQTQGI